MKDGEAVVHCKLGDGRELDLTLSHDIPGANVKLDLDRFYDYVVGHDQKLSLI
jgi:hypothetical protein